MNRPGIAAALSLVVPGLGQAYNGHFFRALLWLSFALLFDVALFVTHMGFGSVVFHVWSSWAAWSAARTQLTREGWRRP